MSTELTEVKPIGPQNPRPPGTVCIVGGGIAGLYSALLLQSQGFTCRIFEGSHRIGGRVHTHYFTQQANQYYEAGAMRIPGPKSAFHKITYDLIKYLNDDKNKLDDNMKIGLITYHLNRAGNELCIGSTLTSNSDDDGSNVAGKATPKDIHWDVGDPDFENTTASDMMKNAIAGFQEALVNAADFDSEFQGIIDVFDDVSFRQYLQFVMGYPPKVIDFMETVLSQTNQYSLSFPEMLMQNLDFGDVGDSDDEKWKTIADGMSRLPNAMAAVIPPLNITYGARVRRLEKHEDGTITIHTTGYNGQVSATFDKVVLAIPPAAVKMLVVDTPWSPRKDMAIRSIHFEPLYKMGLRFKSRFWEHLDARSSLGGQTTTDLPIRWIVFPSNDIEGTKEGVLLIYAWMTDATTWLPLTDIERRQLALVNLAKLYDDDLHPHSVSSLLIETSDICWSQSTATGDAMFLPGQLKHHLEAAREAEGNIYFAGEHLSFHHTWISGAADSALRTVRDMLLLPDLPALSPTSPAAAIPEEMDLDDGLLSFKFIPANPLLYPPQSGHGRGNVEYPMPRNLGGDPLRPVGPAVSHLKATF